jgi:hypothetical protein
MISSMEVGHLRYNADFDSLIKTFIAAANKYAVGEDGIICIKVHIILQDYEKKKGRKIYTCRVVFSSKHRNVFQLQFQMHMYVLDTLPCYGFSSPLSYFKFMYNDKGSYRRINK